MKTEINILAKCSVMLGIEFKHNYINDRISSIFINGRKTTIIKDENDVYVFSPSSKQTRFNISSSKISEIFDCLQYEAKQI